METNCSGVLGILVPAFRLVPKDETAIGAN